MSYKAPRSQHIDARIDKSIIEAEIRHEHHASYERNITKILFDVTKTLGRQGLAYRGAGGSKGSDAN